ncbi:MAG: DUF4416 family protein [Pirellulaceae bacterium]|nr:DUF4416 family protein [Pirellulaceae bacterium]
MAAIELIEPVVRICAVISRHDEAITWGQQRLIESWGTIAHTSPPLPFEANGFYDQQMGTGLQKVLVAMTDLCEPGTLAQWKLSTNQWEKDYANQADHSESRPLNLDCGYITQAKLVLATTKDRDHRLYLCDGIFAEVTLNYVGKKWIHHRWTYPDYRTEQVAEFAQKCRQQVRDHVQQCGESRQRINRNEG